jgi:hypothetical protein
VNSSQPSLTAIPLTKGPKHHFFGYYGICPWDATSRYLVCLETDFHERPPGPEDVAGVGIVELSTGEYHRLAETRAFNLQQGTMLHWLPSEPDGKITYNDRQGDRHVAIVLDIHTGKKRVLPRPIAGISPDGRTAASLNYARLKSLRPVVGYAGLPDVYRDQTHPADDGVYTMDLETGESTLAVSYQQVYEFLGRQPIMDARNIWFNHVVFNTDGTRFCFVNRWNLPGVEIAHTTLLSADVNGGNLRCLTDYDASHFSWYTPTEIIGWVAFAEGAHHYRIDDTTGAYEIYQPEQLNRNGHMSFAWNGRWMLSDTNPDKDSLRDVYLWDMVEERKVVLGRFLSPEPFRGEIRCDPHPRWSRDERQVSFDSVHEGTRQVYMVDVSEVVKP